LTEYDSGKTQYNASVQLAADIGDTVKRIDGTEVPLLTPWQGKAANTGRKPAATSVNTPAKSSNRAKGKTADKTGVTKQEAAATSAAKPVSKADPAATSAASGPGTKPSTMDAPRASGADDLKLIKGVGPKMEALLNSLGFWHWDQVGSWGAKEVAWVDQNLEGFKGRVSRDNWVEQAKRLAAGEQTEFSKRARKDGRYDG
jgi:NADH-quinone oxidoreductase subunit E